MEQVKRAVVVAVPLVIASVVLNTFGTAPVSVPPYISNLEFGLKLALPGAGTLIVIYYIWFH